MAEMPAQAQQPEEQESGGGGITDLIADVSSGIAQIADALEQNGDQDGSGMLKSILDQFQKAITDIGKKRAGQQAAPPVGNMPVDANAGATGVALRG